jgi:2-phosphosulfolactate phosphatase
MQSCPDAHGQSSYSLRADWGSTGAQVVTRGCHVAVVVDVLSFTTTLTVAADRRVTVFPYRWRDDRAVDFAAHLRATLAVGRSQATAGLVSLSPHSVRTAASLQRLVLPSPNGSTISFQLAQAVPEVIGVSLRNRREAAEWLLCRRQQRADLRVAVIAAGERWPDGSLRPAVEDQWGAGSLLDLLRTGGWAEMSPDAHAAADTFQLLRDDLFDALTDCASGRELIAIGYSDDVRTAAELDSSTAVPLLRGNAFEPA